MSAHRNKPAPNAVRPAEIVHLLALHPDLRDAFPFAVAIDQAVRAGA
jgi:hypothetical protein